MFTQGMPRCGRARGLRAVHFLTAGGVLLLGGILLLVGGPRAADAAPGKYHEDTKLGFKIRHPKDWRHIAMGADEKWIAAKYLSDKKCFYTDKETDTTNEFTPVMQVIVFIDDVVKKRGVEKEEEGDTIWISLNNPYKNYKDFLKRTYSGGGWFVSAEDEDKLKDVDVTMYEIKVEKLTYTGPKRIIAWVYHTPEVDFAVQFEVLEDDYKKFKGDVYKCLKSFRLIEREGSLSDVTTGGPKVKRKDEDELSQKDRTLYRKQLEEAAHRKAAGAVTDDWKVMEIGRFLVLNHADDKYAKKTAAHADAVWKWLDKNFGFIGEGEYVPRPILRICKDSDEETAFRRGTSWGNTLDIVTHQDKSSGALSYELEWVNRGVFRNWFRHRNRDMYWAMPWWLDSGFGQVLGTARSKGSRLEFKVDDWERDGLRESARKNELTSPRDLVTLGKREFGQNANRQKQSAAFIRFLLEAKNKKIRRVLEDYLRNLQDVVNEKKEKEKEKADDKKEGGESPKRPETEEEEEEAFRKRQEAYKEKESEFLQEVFDRTFGGWSEKDWKRLETRFFDEIG